MYTDSRHAAAKMDEMNTKNVVSELAPLELAKTEANSFGTADDKQNEMNKVGKSVFYDCIELSPAAEKQDFMKPEQSDTDEESKLGNFVYFSTWKTIYSKNDQFSFFWIRRVQCRTSIKIALNSMASHISVR